MVNWKKLFKKIPNKVQVSRNKFYEILWVVNLPENDGETRFKTGQLILEDNQTPKKAVHTYIHEFMHAFSDAFDVGLTETQIQKVEKGLYYIMKKNNIFKDLE